MDLVVLSFFNFSFENYYKSVERYHEIKFCFRNCYRSFEHYHEILQICPKYPFFYKKKKKKEKERTVCDRLSVYFTSFEFFFLKCLIKKNHFNRIQCKM